jgi:hypothetical protein
MSVRRAPGDRSASRFGLHPARSLGLLVAASALGVALGACTNSGLGQDSGGSGGTGLVTGDCAWVGEWKLTEISCSGFAVTTWFEDFGKATMTITQSSAGGCDVAAAVTDPTCNQDEEWHFSAAVGAAVDMELEGVAGCQPAGCEFPGGAVCTRGSGARTIPGGYIAVVGTDLEAKDLLADTVPTCTLDVVTTWTPK